MHSIRAPLSVWRTNVEPLLREAAHRDSCTSQLKSANRPTTDRLTFPITDSCRTLLRIITRCDRDIPNRITCDTSRRHHLTSCRGAEHVFSGAFERHPRPIYSC